jgi:hypothetical protein
LKVNICDINTFWVLSYSLGKTHENRMLGWPKMVMGETCCHHIWTVIACHKSYVAFQRTVKKHTKEDFFPLHIYISCRDFKVEVTVAWWTNWLFSNICLVIFWCSN